MEDHEIREFLIHFHDYMIPKMGLDTYEQAIYLYIFRRSYLVGKTEALIGFKSARKKLAFGIGKKNTPLSEHVIYDKIKSMQSKGVVEIIDSEYSGTRIKVLLPKEIKGLVDESISDVESDIETIDFFSDGQYRYSILDRENYKCFYCKRKLNEKNYVIEHVISRPEGNNSYRNVVASCRECNNKKNDLDAELFLRNIYREGILSQDDLKVVLSNLELLKAGKLVPIV